MSKFKVGDKVWYEGKVFEIDAVDEILEGQFLYFFDNGYDYEGHESIYLKPYKTPHQELLDLGWKVLDDRNNIMLYHLLVDGKFYYQIKIDNIIKLIDLSYQDVSGYRTTTQLDLKLTSILKRYLEELECSK